MKNIAYFSMEIAVDENIPTYAGGLGVLAGDTIRSLTDLNFPVTAITLLATHFTQKIDSNSNQIEIYEEWDPKKHGLKLINKKINVEIGDEKIYVKAWKYSIGNLHKKSSIYFLDTNCVENSDNNKAITNRLYTGDREHRLKQEIVLGIGGIRLLEILNIKIDKYHLNEGHSALAILELLKKHNKPELKEKIIFTTHTPVLAGHDKFNKNLANELLKHYFRQVDNKIDNFLFNNELNMTYLALNHSNHVNGVAVKHKEVSKTMFSGYPIESITNGVHHLFWTSNHMKNIYDQYLGESWVKTPSCLRYVLSIPKNEIFNAHQKSKKDLITFIKTKIGEDLDENVFTIGWARRFTLYKRSYLIFMNIERLKQIADKIGPMQIIFAGEAAPDDLKGKENLRYVFEVQKALENSKIKIIFIEGYNISIAKKLISGVDLWLNTPQIPLEASGTSGMKAALNGIPSLSSLDGWWLEGHVENITGWSIGKRGEITTSDYNESDELYDKLEKNILPIYLNDKERWKEIMASTIMINGSMFNTHRMVKEYILHSYL